LGRKPESSTLDRSSFAAEGYQRMISGKAPFRVVLTLKK